MLCKSDTAGGRWCGRALVAARMQISLQASIMDGKARKLQVRSSSRDRGLRPMIARRNWSRKRAPPCWTCLALLVFFATLLEGSPEAMIPCPPRAEAPCRQPSRLVGMQRNDKTRMRLLRHMFGFLERPAGGHSRCQPCAACCFHWLVSC